MLREGGGAGDACQRKRDDQVVSNGMPSQRVGVCHNDDGRWWIGGGGKSDEAIRRWSERWIGWLSVESGGASLRGCEWFGGQKRQVRVRRQVELGTQGAAAAAFCLPRLASPRLTKDQQSHSQPVNPSGRAAIPVSAQPSPCSHPARGHGRCSARPPCPFLWNERKMHGKKGARGTGRQRQRALGPIRNPPAAIPKAVWSALRCS